MKKNLRVERLCLRSVLLVAGIVFVAFSFTQCKPKMVVSGSDDYYLLDEFIQFEYEYSLHEGIKYKLLGDYPRSVFFLERSLELFPFSDVALYELSRIYFLGGQYDKSVDYGQKAITISPENLWYHQNLARLFIEMKDNNNAIAVYENAIEVFNDELNLYFTLAALYSAESRFDDALLMYDLLENKIGINERIALPREHIYMEIGEYEKAHNEIMQLIAEFPFEARYYGILAELYTSMEMYSEALDSYKSLFEIDPDNGTAQLSVAEFYLELGNFNEGFDYIELAFRNSQLEFSDKIQILSSLIQDRYLVENHLGQLENLGYILIEEFPDVNQAKAVMSDLYIFAGEYEHAGKILGELYENEPDNNVYAEQYLAVLSFNEENEKVIYTGRKMLMNFPESISIHYFLGVAFYITGETENAIETFENTLTLEGINQEVKMQIYSNLGDLLNKINDFKSSDAYFEEALKIDSNNVFVLNNYAYYLALRGEKLDKAHDFSFKAITMQPENESFLDTYAWIMYVKGDLETALKYIDLAYRKGGSQRYEIVKHYGMILLALDKYNEALKYLVESRELTDDREEVDKVISDVKLKIVN